jgi:hypothetical protein
MENVATLVSHDTGLVIKLVLSSLVRMGYQVAFGLLSVSVVSRPGAGRVRCGRATSRQIYGSVQYICRA